MTKRWFREKRREHFYRLAKKENYRSRAAYKLKQIQDRFNVIHYEFLVVDLGASPGGWSQVAAEIAGVRGKVVAIDLARMKPIDKVTALRGDMRKPETVAAVLKALGDRKADTVLSDMSPDISGTYSIDHARSIELCETAFEFARKALRPGGNFVVKVFQGDMFGDFLRLVKRNFRNVHAYRPQATRSASSELYVVAKGYGMEWSDDRGQGAGRREQGGDRGQGAGRRVRGNKGRKRGKTEEE